MQMLLQLYMQQIMYRANVTFFRADFINNILYKFSLIFYRLKVSYFLRRYVIRPNTKYPFPMILGEYIYLLEILRDLLKMPDINDLIIYPTSRVIPIFTILPNTQLELSSFIYEFKHAGIDININKASNGIISVQVTTGGYSHSFSYSSVIDSNLISMRDEIEKLIRIDMYNNLKELMFASYITDKIKPMDY